VNTPSVAATRRAWHGVAELVLAGPQHRESGTIRLRVSPGGFGTIKDPDLRVDGAELVAGDRRLALDGATCADLAKAAGVVAGLPETYPDHTDVRPDEPLAVDSAAADHLARCFALGDTALRRVFADAEPVLWPEHFDLAVTVDEVNYGVSPGDSYLDEPYAYVGPRRAPSGPFWNAPFGVARALSELSDADAVADFFTEARGRL
jgi:hypothetical protein